MGNLLSEAQKREIISHFLHELERNDISRKMIAEIADVSQPSVSDWFNKKTTAGFDKIAAIAKYFGYEDHTDLRRLGISDRPVRLSEQMQVRLDDIDKLLASIEDPRVYAIVFAKLDSSLAETVDLAKRIQDLLDEQPNTPA